MKNLFTLVFCFIAAVTFAQDVKGVLIDEMGEPLIGASVVFKGTDNGTISDYDGSFSLSGDGSSDVLEISYIGYDTQYVNIDGRTDLGTITLSEGVGLEAIVVTGTMDIVKDRRTPVAVSTITTAEIQAKAGNVEFPELMKSTPSIYVANQAGGYGDSEVFTRGFDQTNTAFLLNGQPINGMEDGKMYWSNWSGMTDVASAVQVQRGLGSSKLAISSVGGTTNIVMKATDKEKGGSVGLLYGNDNYFKATASYNTGMIDDKFGLSVLFSHWQGDGWAEGTKGQGQSYFISAGYKINEKNNLNFLITGAPQWHDQNYSKEISKHYNDPNNPNEFNIKFNDNYGYMNGEYKTLRRNYYHKPVANLNWELELNDKSSLSTVVYASWGNGGGTGGYGSGADYIKGGRTADGYINWNSIAVYNQGLEDQTFKSDDGDIEVKANTGYHALTYYVDGQRKKKYIGAGIRGSRNNHSWYGLVSNFKTELSENVTFNLGADLRTYKGDHHRELVDLLGLNGFDESDKTRYNGVVSETYKVNPWSALTSTADISNSIDYNNGETISYAGVFSQVEYSNDAISFFVQGALSNQNHQRFELHNATVENEASEKVNNLGYNLKTGLSYSINDNNTVFFNTGYYNRQPFHDNIYLNYSNTVNQATVSEKIFGLEAGYKLQLDDFAANFNAYRTSWKDRATTKTVRKLSNGTVLNEQGFANTLQNQLHQGLELDFSYRVNDMLKVKGFGSIGDWVYTGDLNSQVFDEDRNLLEETEGASVEGVKVGGAAQTTFGLGLDITPVDKLTFDVDYNHYANLYSNLGVGTKSLKLPSYGLLDFGVRYMIPMGDQAVTLRANVFNVLGKEYISRSFSSEEASSNESENWNGVNKNNVVTFGKTRTWNISMKYSF